MNTTTTPTPIQLPAGSRAPLIFTFSDIVAGQGFFVRVEVRGRLLARFEEDGVWFDGVSPDNLSAGGTTFNEARAEFRREFTAVLYDLADQHGGTVDGLSSAISRILSQTNAESTEEWFAAVEQVRAIGLAGQIPIETISPETKTYVRVELHQERSATPKRDNVIDPEPALAAA